MEQKVTYGELIAEIAKHIDRPQNFTRTLLDDLVQTAHKGLRDGGKVNIAGFGKFELQDVEEKEQYNPQKDEKVTIPAHQKVNFTPYKSLRKLVNKPYEDMEPKIIEDNEKEREADFIPQGPPSDVKSPEKTDSSPLESRTESKTQTPEKPTRVMKWIGAAATAAALAAGAWKFFKKDE